MSRSEVIPFDGGALPVRPVGPVATWLLTQRQQRALVAQINYEIDRGLKQAMADADVAALANTVMQSMMTGVALSKAGIKLAGRDKASQRMAAAHLAVFEEVVTGIIKTRLG